MYTDPKRVREPYARLRLDRYEAKLLDALVEYTGVGRAELIRQLVMNEALDVFGVDIHGATVAPAPRDCAGSFRAG